MTGLDVPLCGHHRSVIRTLSKRRGARRQIRRKPLLGIALELARQCPTCPSKETP